MEFRQRESPSLGGGSGLGFADRPTVSLGARLHIWQMEQCINRLSKWKMQSLWTVRASNSHSFRTLIKNSRRTTFNQTDLLREQKQLLLKRGRGVVLATVYLLLPIWFHITNFQQLADHRSRAIGINTFRTLSPAHTYSSREAKRAKSYHARKQDDQWYG